VRIVLRSCVEDAAITSPGRLSMYNRKLVFLALLAITAVAGSSPAAAYDYRYCLQGRGIGIPGDCSYRNYAQCMAAASGRGLYCNINPRAAYGRQQRRMQTYQNY
jgi:uncharacterized protein DUF3551